MQQNQPLWLQIGAAIEYCWSESDKASHKDFNTLAIQNLVELRGTPAVIKPKNHLKCVLHGPHPFLNLPHSQTRGARVENRFAVAEDSTVRGRTPQIECKDPDVPRAVLELLVQRAVVSAKVPQRSRTSLLSNVRVVFAEPYGFNRIIVVCIVDEFVGICRQAP